METETRQINLIRDFTAFMREHQPSHCDDVNIYWEIGSWTSIKQYYFCPGIPLILSSFVTFLSFSWPPPFSPFYCRSRRPVLFTSDLLFFFPSSIFLRLISLLLHSLLLPVLFLFILPFFFIKPFFHSLLLPLPYSSFYHHYYHRSHQFLLPLLLVIIKYCRKNNCRLRISTDYSISCSLLLK